MQRSPLRLDFDCPMVVGSCVLSPVEAVLRVLSSDRWMNSSALIDGRVQSLDFLFHQVTFVIAT